MNIEGVKVRKRCFGDITLNDLTYDHIRGCLLWNRRIHVRFDSGTVAGRLDRKGYRVIKVNWKQYKAHRVIWERFNGPVPDGMQIDHIDGNKDNNRLENLRLATNSQNQRNTKTSSRSKTGIKGLTCHWQSGLWKASISVENKRFVFYTKDFDEAFDWLKERRKKLHGQFANFGDPVSEERLCELRSLNLKPNSCALCNRSCVSKYCSLRCAARGRNAK